MGRGKGDAAPPGKLDERPPFSKNDERKRAWHLLALKFWFLRLVSNIFPSGATFCKKSKSLKTFFIIYPPAAQDVDNKISGGEGNFLPINQLLENTISRPCLLQQLFLFMLRCFFVPNKLARLGIKGFSTLSCSQSIL